MGIKQFKKEMCARVNHYRISNFTIILTTVMLTTMAHVKKVTRRFCNFMGSDLLFTKELFSGITTTITP